jgi:hypothetical protein
MKKRLIALLLISWFISICSAQTSRHGNSLAYIPFNNIPNNQKEEVNQILGEMLDGVGLYTILADIKPISTVEIKYFSAFTNGSLPSDTLGANRYQKIVLDKIAHYTKILNEMSDELFYFQFMSPDYSYVVSSVGTIKITVMPEVLILRKDLTRKKIRDKASFFNSIKIDTSFNIIEKLKDKIFDNNTAYSNISLPNIERAYGYLYGYPDYAVDFFVNAGYNSTNEKDRKDVDIPVYGQRNNFTYVIPIEKTLSEEDHKIIMDAKIILEKYKNKRPKYIITNGIDAITLIQDWYKENAKKLNR